MIKKHYKNLLLDLLHYAGRSKIAFTIKLNKGEERGRSYEVNLEESHGIIKFIFNSLYKITGNNIYLK